MKRQKKSERKAQSNNEPTNAQAQYESGKKCFDAKNYEQAVYWWRKAAENGHAEAQYSLGWMYERGYGVGQDKSEAAKWYHKAAEQRHESAKNLLTYFYRS